MATDDNTRTRPFKDVIRNFTPAWFAAIMGTGSISLLFHAFPYGNESETFIIFTLIFFFLNFTLFILFCAISTVRYIMFPDIWGLMIRHPAQSLFTGTFPMGACTLLNIAISLISEKYRLGGKAFLYAMWGLWWLDVAISILCCWGMVHIMETSHKHSLQSMTAVWLLPVVTLIVASSTGGVLSPVLQEYNPGHALFTQVASVFLVAIGLSLALMLLTIYIQRLIIVGVPQGGNVLSVFLPLGPTGQAGYSILLAGQYFKDALPLQHSSSAFLTDSSIGTILYVICVCVAFILWALASMWMVFALLAVCDELRKTRIPFKVNSWGLIFPNGVYANLTISLGSTFDSPFFRIWGAIYAVFTLLLWSFVAVKTVQLVYNRSIFEAPCLQELNLTEGAPHRKESLSPQVVSNSS
ncbi:voltage-dependent anion channel [Lentinula aciculospora]|uniref:Voltage-dependent anion channel n=1 Tax=Lentinula aciculospora TaxID=153920 RepID=A0A9W9DS31_9AGAR|nr:voltage-dependent anion channel [Lentinula aciculospora]